MRALKDLWFRLRALLSRGDFEQELDEEFAFHLDMEIRKLVAEGRPPAEARREALIRFGGEERFREDVRKSWGIGTLMDLGADLRFARRQLVRNPAFGVLAVVTLALGIGGTVALFSVANGLMIRPLPFPDEDQVVTFWMDYNWRGEEFDLVRELPISYQSLAAYSNNLYTLRTDDETTSILGTVASAELFDVLQVDPLLGRTFQEGDDRAGAEPVVILTHGLWQTAFGGDPTVVGRRVNLSGELTTVIGVMPEGFYFPSPEMRAFVPLDLNPANSDYRNNGWLVLTGRLQDGVSEPKLAEDLGLITAALDERYDYPTRWDKTRNPFVVPVREYILGDVAPALLLLLSAVGVLLLMACVNVAALILTKTVDRTREMSVRAALGAGRLRLVRQVLTESVLLGVVSGVVGVALAAGMFDVLVASLPIDAAFRETLTLDWSALVSALLLSVVCGALIALAPMRGLLQGHLGGQAFRDRSQSAGATGGRLQYGLVMAEVLLAVVLVTGASLLVRTVAELRSLDPGFETDGVLVAGVIVSQEETTDAERDQFMAAVQERVSALPGVTDVGFINRVPLRDGGWQGSVTIPDRPDLADVNRPNALYRPVGPEVFDALGIDIVQGRGILPVDRAETPAVAVISETFARTVWGDEDPIGRTYTTGFVGEVEVVGVARDIAVTDLINPPPMVGYYAWDQAQAGAAGGILVVKTGGDPASLVAPLRTIVREVDPRATVSRTQTMPEVLDAEMVEPLRLRFFFGMFGLLGLLLGAVGVYGVVSYSVERRRTEFGLRMALGAKPRGLLVTVVGRALAPVVLGVFGGLVVALVATRALAGFLFGVSPSDPASLALSAAALLLTGIAAALLPAFRASSTEPAVALRAD